jgi:DNA-binding MarR family transcriptional regulator
MKENSVTINCLAFQLSQARKKVQKWYEQHLATLGLNTSYIYVMEVIKEFGPSSLTLVAEKLELERATVSNLLGRMERDEFIIRMPGKERRSMEVHLTEKGKAILDEALNCLQECDRQLNEILNGELSNIKQAVQQLNNKI